jgi:phosphatidate cytidylyltransferase
LGLVERHTLRLRLLSALVMAPVALAAAWLGGWCLAALVALLAAGMAQEWARITGRGALGFGGAVMMLSAVLAILAMAAGFGGVAIIVALAGGALATMRAAAPGWAAIGSWWIALPCVAFLWLAALQPGGRATLFWLLATVWASDTGAYIAGRTIGGPRLAPRLSPNKTWAGAGGGLVGAALVGAMAAWLSGAPAAMLVPVGLGLGLAAQLGDLAESFAKRRFGVKDSGSLIPGHGGLLDRLDGMLTASAALAVVVLVAGASPIVWRG